MSESIRRIRPTPSGAYLGNPHKGCCTFQRFNGDVLFPGITWSEEGPVDFPAAVGGAKDFVEGYLPSTVAYCRWFWPVLEPERGKYDFSVIDRSLEVCGQRGQTLAVRLMAFGSAKQPQVPGWYSAKYPMADWTTWSGATQQVPRHDAAEYLEHWGNMMLEFARRYDGHPLLETVDIAFLGPWGEGAGECTGETCAKFAELFKRAFVKTPRLALVGGEQFRSGIESGAGWRCDCFGDLCVFGSPPGTSTIPSHLAWNHTFDEYPFVVARAGARDVWRRSPIHLETCSVPLEWHRRGFDIDFILQQGLKMHATYFMPKSTRLPERWMDKIAAFCRTLGYRYIFRQGLHDTLISRDKPFVFKSWIENVGVAPIYRRYDFALRFRQDGFEKLVVLEDVNILDWLPGDACVDAMVQPPAGLRPGPADLSVGLVAPGTNEAKIRFAIKENYPDRWVPLCPIYIS